MVRVYQLMRGAIDQDNTQFFQLDNRSRTRGHSKKLLKPEAVSRVRRASFGIRIVNDWNALPAHVIDAPSVNAFKSRLDLHWAQDMFHVPDEDLR